MIGPGLKILNGSYTLIKGRSSKRIKKKQVKERGNGCRERRYTAVIRRIGAVQRASRSRSAAWPCEDEKGGGGRDVVGGVVEPIVAVVAGWLEVSCLPIMGQFPLEQGF